jgi:hypothetical protein
MLNLLTIVLLLLALTALSLPEVATAPAPRAVEAPPMTNEVVKGEPHA